MDELIAIAEDVRPIVIISEQDGSVAVATSVVSVAVANKSLNDQDEE